MYVCSATTQARSGWCAPSVFVAANLLGAVVYVPYAVGIGFGLGYGVGEYAERVRHVFRALITWNTGASMYLALAWSTIVLADAETTRMRARMQDSSRYVIFVLVVTAAAASVVAIGFLLGNAKELAFWPRTIRLTLCAFALGSSWLLIQTVFAFHYARRFYMSRLDPHFEPRGLHFPGGSDPDFLDFAYFAFVVGMTSQVSDVAVTAQHMRRATLMHCFLSFVFNIAILALSINVIAGVV